MGWKTVRNSGRGAVNRSVRALKAEWKTGRTSVRIVEGALSIVWKIGASGSKKDFKLAPNTHIFKMAGSENRMKAIKNLSALMFFLLTACLLAGN
jgi:hypothetical protein